MSLAALTAAAVLTAGAATPAAPVAPTPYALAWLGDLAGARAALPPRLAAEPKDAESLLVLACLEVEAGRLDAAADAAARLAAVEPSPPEARVLAALVARRRAAATAKEPLADALVAAWKAAGRPDLSKGTLLAAAAERGFGAIEAALSTTEADLARLAPEEAFLLGGLTHPARSSRPAPPDLFAVLERWSATHRAQAQALFDRPGPRSLALDLALSWTLEEGAPRRSIREALILALPENGYFPLVAALDSGSDDAPLTAADLDAIEAALAKPRLTPPYRPVYVELTRIAGRLAPAHAPLLARAAFGAVAPPPSGLAKLPHRARATTDPALRKRAVAALGRAAATLDRDPTVMMMGWMLGAICENSAATLAGDEPRRQAINERVETFRAKADAASQALSAPRWPLPTTWREFDPEDEVAAMRRLVE